MPLGGSYFTDDGEVARRWALAGPGVVRKSAIDVVADIHAGRLVQLLPEWRSDAVPINLVCPHRSPQVSERVRQLQRFFAAALPALDGRSLWPEGFRFAPAWRRYPRQARFLRAGWWNGCRCSARRGIRRPENRRRTGR